MIADNGNPAFPVSTSNWTMCDYFDAAAPEAKLRPAQNNEYASVGEIADAVVDLIVKEAGK